MYKQLIVLLLLFRLCLVSDAQQLTTSNYRDTTITYIEVDPSNYNFNYPILSDILDSTNFSPPTDGVYLKASFGHRYLSSTTYRSDNHGGFDFWDDHQYQGTTYNSTNRVSIASMCDGYISLVTDGPDSILNQTATGRSVRVTCDSSFQSLGFKIKINYRHLNHVGRLAKIADTAAFGTVSIRKGDTIGEMGNSGTTSNVHLHMSTQTIHPVYGSAFVNTTRLFDPNKFPGVLGQLNDAKIELLQNWNDSALFRIIWPFNQTINQFEFMNQTDTVIFNKEAAYNTGSANRDLINCIQDVNVFAYQFNGKQTAKARYLLEMNNMPAIYPAATSRDTNVSLHGYSHYPITHDSVAYVYDFMVKNLTPTHLPSDFKVKVSDVWGYAVEGTFPSSVGIEETPTERTTIFPNPTTGILNVDLKSSGEQQPLIYDLNGKLVKLELINGNKNALDLTQLPNGMYFLQIRSKHDSQTLKVIKN